MRDWLAVDLSSVARFARDCALVAACFIVASATAVVALLLVRALALVTDWGPELFLTMVFAVALWAFVRLAFRRREEN